MVDHASKYYQSSKLYYFDSGFVQRDSTSDEGIIGHDPILHVALAQILLLLFLSGTDLRPNKCNWVFVVRLNET